jgi:serine/threonine protein kinase
MIMSLIGVGSSGPVFLCKSILDGDHYSVKILSESPYKSIDPLYESLKNILSLYKSRKRFNRNVIPMPSGAAKPVFYEPVYPLMISHTIDGNPHVVQMIDAMLSKNKKHVYLVMEFLPGLTLRQFLNYHRAFHSRILLRDSKEIIRQVLHGLYCIHKDIGAHGDVRPENIMILENISHTPRPGGPYNYGRHFWATLFDGVLYGDLHFERGRKPYIGHHHQMIRQDSEALQIDLYNVGLVFYELILRRLPLPGYQLPSAATIGQVPVTVDKWLEKLWKRKFTNALDALKELEEITFKWEFGKFGHRCELKWFYPIEDDYS